MAAERGPWPSHIRQLRYRDVSVLQYHRQLEVEWLNRNGGTEQGCAGFRSGEMLGYSQVARSTIDVHLLCVNGPKGSYCVQVPTRY